MCIPYLRRCLKNSAGGASTAPPARSTKIRRLGLNFARLGFGTRLVAHFGARLVADLGTWLADHLGARLGRWRAVAGDAPQAQAHALALLVEADDLGRNGLAGLEQIARLGLRVDIQLAGMDQALDGLFDLDEGAEWRDIRNRPADELTQAVALVDCFPRVGLEPSQTQADPLALGVDLDDHDLDLLAGREYLARVVDPLPGQLGDVRQAVGAAQVDKCAEVSELVDATAQNIAGLQLAEQAMLLGLAPLLSCAALG